MESFKKQILINDITGALMSGRPLSKQWGIPSFMKNNLKALFGQIPFSIYQKMPQQEKQVAIKWFQQGRGIEATQIYGGQLWENWNDETIPKRDMISFSKKHTQLYRNVVELIVKRAFSQQSEDARKKLIEFYISQPQELEKSLKENVG